MSVEIDVSEARQFFEAMEAAAKGGFRKELEAFLEGIGEEFLRLVEDEIIRREAIDTRLLLASFHKGGDSNVWELSEGGLTLEVGSTLEYASYVNDGHWTNPQGVAEWVKGKPYFDSALRILEKMLPELLDAKIQEWLDSYFG